MDQSVHHKPTYDKISQRFDVHPQEDTFK